MWILGLDPGGERKFGWCLGTTTHDTSRKLPRLKLCHWGTAAHAKEAIEKVLSKIDPSTKIDAVGIDSPLFWISNGDRQCDKTIREAMKNVGAPNTGGRVQSVNSLRGACLVQGIMAARLLRSKFPRIRITESHPKALLWLLKIANNRRPVSEVTLTHLADFLECKTPNFSEDERDAAIGALAAAAMSSEEKGWRDLALDETDAFPPVSPVEYWMPIARGTQ